MFGFAGRVKAQSKAVAMLVAAVTLVGIAAQPLSAQMSTTRRRETNANRQARIARQIQDTYSHRYEIAGGIGYLRFQSGPYLQKNNEVTWHASDTYFLNPKLGITADARGGFGQAKVLNDTYRVYNPWISEYTFMGGVTYRAYAKKDMAVSVNGLGGYSIGDFNGGSKAIDSPLLGMWRSENKPVFSFGANFDYNIYPNLAVRVGPTYVGTLFNNQVQNNVGFNVGMVYRFKRIK